MAGSPLLSRLRNRSERLRQRRWRMAAYRSSQRHIVLGGAPRSGTTLLRRLLDRHPELRAGPETKLFVPAAFNLAWLAEAYSIPVAELEEMRRDAVSQAAFIDAFALRVTGASGKTRWAEKTPQNIRHLDWILEHFPECSVVHVLRDGRDVVCSMREHPDWRWVDGAWQKVLVTRPLEWYARRWLDDTAAGLARRDDPRYVEVRYEELVGDPVATLRRLCQSLAVVPQAAWLDTLTAGEPGYGAGERGKPADQPGTDGPAGPGGPSERAARPDYEGAVSAGSVGRWRSDLGELERIEVERLCGPRLRQLGYEA